MSVLIEPLSDDARVTIKDCCVTFVDDGVQGFTLAGEGVVIEGCSFEDELPTEPHTNSESSCYCTTVPGVECDCPCHPGLR